jgi:hypothetical protein
VWVNYRFVKNFLYFGIYYTVVPSKKYTYFWVFMSNSPSLFTGENETCWVLGLEGWVIGDKKILSLSCPPSVLYTLVEWFGRVSGDDDESKGVFLACQIEAKEMIKKCFFDDDDFGQKNPWIFLWFSGIGQNFGDLGVGADLGGYR